jgi:hypothetical protein
VGLSGPFILKSTLEISNANVYQALVDRDPTEMALELVSGFRCLPALTIGISPRAGCFSIWANNGICLVEIGVDIA